MSDARDPYRALADRLSLPPEALRRADDEADRVYRSAAARLEAHEARLQRIVSVIAATLIGGILATASIFATRECVRQEALDDECRARGGAFYVHGECVARVPPK